MSFIIPLVITLIIIYLLDLVEFFKSFWKCYVSSKKIPGPVASFFTGNLGVFADKESHEVADVFKNMAHDARKNGLSILRVNMITNMQIWPLDGETSAKILESTTELNKGRSYSFIKPWLGDGLLLQGYGNTWKSHRKMLTPAFHFAKLNSYIEIFNEESKIIVEIFEKYADSKETIDLFDHFKRYALDVICQTAIGVKVDAQYNHDHSYLHAIENVSKLWGQILKEPYLQNPFIFWMTGRQKEFNKNLNAIKQFIRDVIKQRTEMHELGEVEETKSKKMMNFLDLLLSLKESENLTEKYIEDEVDTFMFGGHDTTTSSVSFACWTLANHPEVQDKVYEEIQQVLGDDPNLDVTTEHLSKLEYFERVLKECKRLIAPVPVVDRELRNDLDMGGYTIPAGSTVCIAPFIVHSNPKTYPNPEKFDPDRFLPENVTKRHTYDFIPFSAGLRNCIGQKFGQMNEKVVLTHVLRNFKIVPTKKFDEVKIQLEAVVKPIDGIPVKLVRRNQF